MSYTEIRVIKSDIKVYPNEFDGEQTPPSLCKNTGKEGVYVWGFYEPQIGEISKEKFHPLYVGKTANLYERLIQHYCRLRGGEYQMFDLKIKMPHLPIYEPKCFNIDVINYPQPTQILENFAFRYVLVDTGEDDRKDGEKYLTEKILEKLCGQQYPKVNLKEILLSGCRATIDQLFPVKHTKSRELDEMIADIF